MGKRGPKPTPTAELKRRGSWLVDTRKDEPEANGKAPKCPEILDDDGRVVWKWLVGELTAKGLLDTSDRETMCCYCLAVVHRDRAIQTLAEEGEYVTTDKGFVMAHPALKERNQAMAHIKQFGAEFGFSPASRTGVRTSGGKDTAKDGKKRFLKITG